MSFEWATVTPWVSVLSPILFQFAVFESTVWLHDPVTYKLHLSNTLTFDSEMLWYTKEFMVESVTARCTDPKYVDFLNIIQCITAVTLYFRLVYLTDIAPKVFELRIYFLIAILSKSHTCLKFFSNLSCQMFGQLTY